MAKKGAKKLDELFHDTLKDIYFAEKKILAALPKMEKAAQAPQLKRAFAKHKTETEGHLTRLEKVFAAIDQGTARENVRCDRRHHRRRRGDHEGIQRFPCPRRRTSRSGAGGRALRNLPLRHTQDLGK